MTNPLISPHAIEARTEFENLIKDIRPELHRYVARMVGSVIDGEDVVQETLAKAYYALPTLSPDANLRGWLFRIAHNKAIDFVRGRKNRVFEQIDEFPPVVEPDFPLEKKELASIALTVFLRLVPSQRSCVILKDVLDYSLAEISEILNKSVPEIKAVLHRGRTRLRELAETAPEKDKVVLNEEKKALLNRYIKLFNARDFDGVRELLADEARLDLVNHSKLASADEIRNKYFYNYDKLADWRFALGAVEKETAILVYDPLAENERAPEYFILLDLKDDKVTHIRDFRYARYVIKDADLSA
jgi:RNA polymerase sigma-70 factor, ECF subfamily